ncbi:hypothetical protein [Thalassotalea castellviae]|uniref:AsmA family protein n=1 Tax=Thalassotalea castellviae TaxID=3075612 RepID=A0ABU2ZYL5_9GAMM|nr:hypothetical protein [Thalassotalea sp. W431]MDT0602991.1 hypothetical protein [Thalassotalea sp. W431]
MKFLASIVVVILLACGGALWFLAGGSLNEFVKGQIETVGKQITEQKVAVNSVDIKLTQGAGSIIGISLANGSEYNYPHAFTLGEVTLDINVESLTQEPIIIDAIIIKDPKAFVEFTASGASNMKDLIDTIQKNIPNAGQKNADTESASTKAEPKLSVSKVVLAGTALTVDLSALGNKEHSATLPDIILNDIGGKDGLPASELGGVIVKEALSAIWKETKNTQKEQLKKQATDKLKDKAKKKLSELFNKS